MRIHALSSFVALLLSALAVAQARPIPYPITAPRDWLAAVAAGTRSKDGLPGPDHWTAFARYVIDAELEPASARVHGHARMTWLNRSRRPVHSLVLMLRQNLHRADAVRNTAVEITGGMTIDDIRCGELPLAAAAWDEQGTVATVNLPEPIAAGGEATLAMDFAFTMPKAGAPRMGHDDHVFYLGYWYPQFAVFDDVAGWKPEPYLGNGEFYMDYADYEVAFTAPVNWLVRATGELQNGAQVLTGAERDALDAAASGHEVVHVVTGKDLNNGTVTQPSASGKLTWKFRAANVRDFAIATGDQYVWDATGAVVKDQGGPGKDGSCLIHAVYRQRCRAWRKAARYAQHTIEWVSANLNPYPWPQMTACEGLLGGGMEYPMMTWIGDMGAPSLQQAVIAHELIHMWFPMQVGSDEAAHAWQDEGLTDFVTDFVTADWFQHKKVGERTLQEYVAVARASDHEEPLMRHGDHYETEMAYGFCSYTKPAAMLHQLVGMRGRDQVFGALKSYVQAWSFKHPTPYDLFALLNGALGENLDWYWRTWCFETWHLDQAIAEVQDDGAATTVVIEDLGEAPGPAHVRVTYADESTEDQTVDVHEWLQGKRRAVLHFRAGVIKAVLDPEHTTMDIDPRNNVWRKGG